ncbi:hypothetical protein [Paracoccus shanxieyensis]|uniref:Uncharacterized protein n=1 Tax=Paracoccus shanxieyensis TaxID=2675752 RepID=A0A6L6IYU3_9RHOB|nr:hypothetical protein [Paracoccus shanxieyensis]MTH65079.1 hypothetical protein [Paracoccus shanxieyensis]MTH88223.1 hypothetical protein [Paracoccus shanxieyensis]
MTVESTKNKSGPFVATGSSGVFPRDFLLLDPAHLRVIRVRGFDEDEITSGITHTGVGSTDGTVAVASGLAIGDQVYLLRAVPNLQRSDYNAQGRVPTDQAERDFDLAVMQIQDIAERQSRALTLPVSSELTGEEAMQAALDAPQYALRAEQAAREAQAAASYTVADLADLLYVPRALPIGSRVLTRAERYSYDVVASGGHLVSASGAHLQIVPRGGQWSFGALAPAGDGVTDDRPKFVIANAIGGEMHLPAPAVRYAVSAPVALTVAVNVDARAPWVGLTDSGRITFATQRTTNLGGKVNRIPDRVFVGRAAQAFAGNSGSGDGGTSIFSTPASSPAYLAVNASHLVEAGSQGQYGSVDVVQTAILPGGAAGIAHGAAVVNDRPGGRAWGYIAEIQHEPGALNANGVEWAIKNKSEQNTTYRPYQRVNGTFASRAVAGGDATFGGAATNPSTAAHIIIRNNEGGNTHAWNSGIVFTADALTGTDGSAADNGLGEAMSLARNHYIGWYAPDTPNGLAAIITSRVTQTQNRMRQFFADDAVVFDSLASGGAVFRAQHVANGVNYLQATNGPTGSGAILAAVGPDANINLRLQSKGTGRVQFGTVATQGAYTINGFIEVLSLQGEVVKLARVA